MTSENSPTHSPTPALVPPRLVSAWWRAGTSALLVLVATGVLGKPLNTAISYVFDKMFFIAQFGFDIVAR